MKQRLAAISATLALSLTCVIIGGCGGGTEQSQDKSFFTSGNREADQRADQRMAQQHELNGANNGGEKSAEQRGEIATEKKTLYERLGGDVGIKAIVEDFLTRAMADPRVNWQRVGVTHGGISIHREASEQWEATGDKVKILKIHLAQFIALSTGGPSQYTGKPMGAAHANMHISNPEFDAVVGDMKATLDKLQIADAEQKELLAIVESTREEIVEER